MNRFRDRSQSDPRLTDSCPFRYGVAGMEASEHGARNGQKGRLFFVLTACRLAWPLGLVGQGKDAEGSRYVATSTGEVDAEGWPLASQAEC
jgi:hypothetical protein